MGEDKRTNVAAFGGALATRGWHFFAYGAGAVFLAMWGLIARDVPPVSVIFGVIAVAFFLGGYQAWRKERIDFLQSDARFGESINRPYLTANDPIIGYEYAGGTYDFTVPLVNGATEVLSTQIEVEIYFGDKNVGAFPPFINIGHLGPLQQYDFLLPHFPFPAGITSFPDADKQLLLMKGTITLEYIGALNGLRYRKVEHFGREMGGKARIVSREAPILPPKLQD